MFISKFKLFLLFIFNGIYLHFTAYSSDSFNIVRSNDNNEILAQYTNNISTNEGCKYNLNYLIDRKLVNEVEDYKIEPGVQYGKSHVLINGFNIYKKDKNSPVYEYEYETFTEKNFPITGKTSDKKIDWSSNQSLLSDTDTVIRRKSNEGNGHSEPQLISDINSVFVKNQEAIFDLLTPRQDSLKKTDSKLEMSGIELYGSFDMCDTCLTQLVDFRKNHQEGQRSISQYIKDKMKNQCTDTLENLFVIIYHTSSPYHNANYYARSRSSALHKIISIGESDEEFKYEAFRSDNIKEGIDPSFANKTLNQSNNIIVNKDIIYGQMHLLFNKNAQYTRAYYQNTPDSNKYIHKFIFKKD